MGTTADKLNKIVETKEAIRQAISDKGVVINDNTPFADYPKKISAITGSSEGSSGGIAMDSFYNVRTKNGTNYDGLFAYYNDYNSVLYLDLSNLDSSNVTTMQYMFYNCDHLYELDISNFDTSNVTNMSCMFLGCSSLISLDISNFNTSNVTDMSNMFQICESLTTINGLSNFNTSNVTAMNNMFYNCQVLTELDLSSWDTSKVTDINNMFYGCRALTELDLSNFDLSACLKKSFTFNNCVSLHTLRLDNCSNDTINKIITLGGFPTKAISGKTRTIYCKESEATGLTPPTNWVFSYVD